MKWKQDPNHESDEYGLWLVSEDGWWKVWAKWDGCCHLYRAHNVPFSEKPDLNDRPHPAMEDYLHICDVQEVIDLLTDLKQKGVSHFSEWE